ALLIALLAVGVWAQSQRRSRPEQPKPVAQPTPPPKQTPSPEADVPKEPADVDTVKTDTDLVTVPVIATDRNGVYVADLRQEEFAIAEDGVAQEISFFGTVSQPFHVVLMLDTSASTREKLRLIQQAASAFVDQLQPQDRVKVISFDDEVRDL